MEKTFCWDISSLFVNLICALSVHRSAFVWRICCFVQFFSWRKKEKTLFSIWFDKEMAYRRWKLCDDYRCSIRSQWCLLANWFYFILNWQCHLQSHLFLAILNATSAANSSNSYNMWWCVGSYRSPLVLAFALVTHCSFVRGRKVFLSKQIERFFSVFLLFFFVLFLLSKCVRFYFICSKDIWVPFRFISSVVGRLTLSLSSAHTENVSECSSLYLCDFYVIFNFIQHSFIYSADNMWRKKIFASQQNKNLKRKVKRVAMPDGDVASISEKNWKNIQTMNKFSEQYRIHILFGSFCTHAHTHTCSTPFTALSCGCYSKFTQIVLRELG